VGQTTIDSVGFFSPPTCQCQCPYYFLNVIRSIMIRTSKTTRRPMSTSFGPMVLTPKINRRAGIPSVRPPARRATSVRRRQTRPANYSGGTSFEFFPPFLSRFPSNPRRRYLYMYEIYYMVMRSRILSDAYYFSPERKTAPPGYIYIRASGIRTIPSVARDCRDGNPVERRRWYIFVFSSRSCIGFLIAFSTMTSRRSRVSPFFFFMYVTAFVFGAVYRTVGLISRFRQYASSAGF